MRVIDLPPGEKAPDDGDRVSIHPTRNGFQVNGVVAQDHAAIFNASPNLFPTFDEARRAALAWAEENGAELVYVESTPT